MQSSEQKKVEQMAPFLHSVKITMAVYRWCKMAMVESVIIVPLACSNFWLGIDATVSKGMLLRYTSILSFRENFGFGASLIQSSV